MPVQKYYAVAQGRTPGVYTNWEKAKAQVLRFEGALYKSFVSEVEAFAYMKRNMPDEAYQKAHASALTERAKPAKTPALPKLQPRQVPALAQPTPPPWLEAKTQPERQTPTPSEEEHSRTRAPSQSRDDSPVRAQEEPPTQALCAPLPNRGTNETALCFYISGAHTQGAAYVGLHTLSLGEPLPEYCVAVRAQVRSQPTPERCQLYGARVAVEIAKHLCMEEFTIYFGAMSNTVVYTINAWMHKWAANGWSSGHGDGKLPNLDLVRPLYDSIRHAQMRPQAHSAPQHCEEIERARQYAAVLMNSEKLRLIGLF